MLERGRREISYMTHFLSMTPKSSNGGFGCPPLPQFLIDVPMCDPVVTHLRPSSPKKKVQKGD